MRLSTRARYALRFMLNVHQLSERQEPVSIAKVAQRAGMSKRYLEKLVAALKRADLLRPVSGRTGGYILARPAQSIRLGEIIEASIGPINIVECVHQPDACWKSDLCECREIYTLINNRITEALNEYTLADMADRTWRERIQVAQNQEQSRDRTPRSLRVQ
jgi:Rrf2 family protein